jgi:dipeptidyl aminopeptidase/acylaminoacyl peptidase
MYGLSATRGRLIWIGVSVWPLLLAPQSLCATPTQSAPLRIEDALGQLALNGPIALSHDGLWIAYTVQDNRKREVIKDQRYALYTPTGAWIGVVGCDILITNTKTRETKNLTQGKGSSWWPVWSPDGRHLAFYSDRSGVAHLWVWDRDTAQLRELSDAIARPSNFQIVRWTPDSRKILVPVLPEGMTVEQAADLAGSSAKRSGIEQAAPGPTVTVYSYSPPSQARSTKIGVPNVHNTDVDDSFAKRFPADLALVDEAGGNADRIATGIPTRLADYWISPDGKYLAYTRDKGQEPNSQQSLYELAVLGIANKTAKVLVSNFRAGSFGTSVSWSPDSRSLAYTVDGKTTKGGDCYLVSIDHGDPQILTEGAHPPFGGDLRGPLWDAAGNYIYLISSEYYVGLGTDDGRPTDTIWKTSVRDHSLSITARIPDRTILQVLGPAIGGRVWSPDGGHFLMVATRDEGTKKLGFHQVDISNGKSTKLFEDDSYFGPALTFDVSDDGETFLYAAEDAQHPRDLWAANADFTNRRHITSINPNLDNVAFGASRVMNWRSIDGAPLRGALLLPANYQQGQKCPLIVDVYGGDSLSAAVYRFGLAGSGAFNLQLLATRGYAVLVPDAPLQHGTPMLDLLKTVIPGVDRVVDLAIADPDRLGVTGLSYGGYSTLALIVQTGRFKAAVDRAGPADLMSNYGVMGKDGSSSAVAWSETGQGRMMGTPWEFRDRYIQNSPIFYLDHVQTPLLIIQGDLDTAVTYQQSEEVFVGLRRLGKEVVYAKYAGEGHSEYTWSSANVIDYWTRVIDWFDGHLKGDAPQRGSSSPMNRQ